MTLDSRFIIASDLQSVFVDKDTGEPLAGGVLTFYQDDARTEPKSVYKLSGSAPNYSYTDMGNEITLTVAGTPGDGDGNDIILYYFPYEGTPDDSNGDIQLYYVTVESSEEVPQFSREAWPNLSLSNSGGLLDTTNYIPNGQFLIHNDLPDDGEISEAITVLSQGGWTFERPEGSTATDIVTFDSITYTENPSGNPKFAFHLQTELPGEGDDYKDLRIKFDDVNEFASTELYYTFGMEAIDNSGNDIEVSLVLIKNYGTGGSPQTETTIKTWELTSTYDLNQVSFLFGSNSGKTIGPDGDDFIQLAIRFNVDQIQDISITNIQLRPNAVSLTDFPTTTESEFSYQTITAEIPDHNGGDLYLMPRLGPNRWLYDIAEVGDFVFESNVKNYDGSISTITNRLLADGSQYETAGYSPLGIPYSRLQNYYWSDNFNAPIYGTGPQYLTMYSNAADHQMRVSVNSAGVAANATDGTPATGFTFANIHVGAANYGWSAKSVGSSTVLLICNTRGTGAVVSAGTTPFTVTSGRITPQVNATAHIETALGLSGGEYYTINFDAPYYIWFKVAGVGVDPAPGGTGILIDLIAVDDTQLIADNIAEALNAVTQTNITCVAGSSIVAGSCIYLSTVSTNYYVWFKKDGVGTDPAPASRVSIGPVLALTGDTEDQVAVKMQIAINQKYFATPKSQGLFPRGYDPNSLYDTDFRWGTLTNNYGQQSIGTTQSDQLLEHVHSYLYTNAQEAQAGIDISTPNNFNTNTSATGSYENRPYNFNTNIAIKY